MSTFVIGDIQGCYRSLQALLEKIPFDSKRDSLWMAGDLVNRGPGSLEVLRWAKKNQVKCVLGNHDLWLLACAAGAKPKGGDTLEQILSAKDKIDLVEWVRHLPFVIKQGKALLVHAGLLPQWTGEDALYWSDAAEKLLQGSQATKTVQRISDKEKIQWVDAEGESDKAYGALSVFVRIRICTPEGKVDFDFDAEPKQSPKGFYPWFEVPGRKSAGSHVIFGHWSALGLYQSKGITGIDTGCVWGRSLTAYCLESKEIFQQPNMEKP